MDTDTAKLKVIRLIGQMDHRELAVRLIEIGCKMQRRPGVTGAEAWDDVKRSDVPEYIKDDFEKMALAAIAYFNESVSELQQVN